MKSEQSYFYNFIKFGNAYTQFVINKGTVLVISTDPSFKKKQDTPGSQKSASPIIKKGLLEITLTVPLINSRSKQFQGISHVKVMNMLD